MTAAHSHLDQYWIAWQGISKDEADACAKVLATASNEAAMQEFLERHPRFLVQHLAAQNGYWIVPQKRLGSEHVPDFLVGHRDVDQLLWNAIEIERPQAKMFTSKGDPSAALTHALRQIADWRDWLSHNRDYASRLPQASGLGLVDIDPELDGLIIIGREETLTSSVQQRRRRLIRESRVQIRTYDWLLDQARNGLKAKSGDLISEIFAWQFKESDRHAEGIIRAVFGGIAMVSSMGARSDDWEEVSIEIGGEEHSIVYEEVRDYGTKERTLDSFDWEDWLVSAGRHVDQLSMLVTEVAPEQGLQDSLKIIAEGIWFKRTSSWKTRVDLLLFLPLSMTTEARRNRAGAARDFFSSVV